METTAKEVLETVQATLGILKYQLNSCRIEFRNLTDYINVLSDGTILKNVDESDCEVSITLHYIHHAYGLKVATFRMDISRICHLPEIIYTKIS